jgi:endonuclease/exonuclease/phosphatase family metal-dependent hydrolase
MSTNFRIATFNVLNLHDAEQSVYGEILYSNTNYARKIEWLAAKLDEIDADIVALQEIWSEQALRDVVAASERMREASVVTAPWAGPGNQLPRVAFVSRFAALEPPVSLTDIPAHLQLELPDAPELGLRAQRHSKFSRPILKGRFALPEGSSGPRSVTVFTLHLKSKRPERLETKTSGEDLDKPAVQARATLRSLIMRGCEAAAVRELVIQETDGQLAPCIVLGDFNDTAESVTTELVTGKASPNDKAARDTLLYNAVAIQSNRGLKREVGYSHLHFSTPSVLDHILVSEEFVAGGKFSIGQVQTVQYFNDHLNSRELIKSDHGIVCANLSLDV